MIAPLSINPSHADSRPERSFFLPRARPGETNQTAVVAPVTAEQLQAARQKLIEAGAHTDRREPRETSAVSLKVQ
jgi:hypothetical protein